MTFSTLGLSEPILRAVLEQGYQTPTPIQTQAIPVVLRGQDLLASAQTGTGKTAGFVLPLLERLSSQPRATNNQISVLVLAPTRELAAQIHDSVLQYGQYLTNLRSAVVFGGVKINPQMMKLRGGIDILIATPGRLLDLFQQRAVRFDHVKTLVLDEADRMLDMGFIHDIKRIMSKLPKVRQTLLFSATFSKEICQLAKEFLVSPVEISVTPRNEAAVNVSQKVHPVDKGRKAELLSHLIRRASWAQALVFSRTKHGANKLVKLLAVDGIDAVAIHGNKSQSQRMKALSDFKDGKVHIMVATDIAARGIDIDELPMVINFDLPQVAEDYVHRIGRTGRAGSVGGAISLVSADEIKQLQEIERLIKRRIERVEIDDFEPKHQVPLVQAAATPSVRRYDVKSRGYGNKNAPAQARNGARTGGRSAGRQKTEGR
ncbi:MAG: DEAD/DEAH box helicase [Legionellaceae bacterium]|nr:DEAD/DEAH box helicase [Legionellaceae bacterium]